MTDGYQPGMPPTSIPGLPPTMTIPPNNMGISPANIMGTAVGLGPVPVNAPQVLMEQMTDEQSKLLLQQQLQQQQQQLQMGKQPQGPIPIGKQPQSMAFQIS